MSDWLSTAPGWTIAIVLVARFGVPPMIDAWKARNGKPRPASSRPSSLNGKSDHYRETSETHAVITRADEFGTPLIFKQGERQTALLERIAEAVERDRR